jgi:hypothetical protein
VSFDYSLIFIVRDCPSSGLAQLSQQIGSGTLGDFPTRSSAGPRWHDHRAMPIRRPRTQIVGPRRQGRRNYCRLLQMVADGCGPDIAGWAGAEDAASKSCTAALNALPANRNHRSPSPIVCRLRFPLRNCPQQRLGSGTNRGSYIWPSVKSGRAGSRVGSNPFIASGTSDMGPEAAISIMSLSFGMLGFVMLGLTIIEHL